MLADQVEVRPRTTGEILDDAWRLYLAHAPQLLALSGLFRVPAAVVLLLLLAGPVPEASTARWLLPALAATLLPLTGLGSGACQEACRRLAEGKPIELAACLVGGLRHGLRHTAGQAVVLAAAAPGLIFLGWTGLAAMKSGPGIHLFLLALGELFWVGLVFWIASDLHPVLAAGEGTLSGAGQAVSRTIQLHPGKAAAVVFSRLLLHLFAMLNLHLLALAGLEVAGNLAGLDTVVVGVLISWKNPAYVLALVLLGWLLLAPWSEAASYLLHVDLRARYEGLDLWYRVQRHFPTGDRRRAGAAVLALAAGLLLAVPGRAAADRLTAIREVRQEVRRITAEVRSAEPYPGGGRWAPRLEDLARRLNPDNGVPARRSQWFNQAIEGFADRSREGALQVLADLERQLALIEESLTQRHRQAGRAPPSSEEIKKLLPQPSGDSDPAAPPAPQPERAEDRQPVVRDDEADRIKVRSPGLVGPSPGAGLAVIGWAFLAGLLVAVLAVAGVLFVRWRRQSRLKPAAPVEEDILSLESILTESQQSAATLWRRAEDLAGEGQFLEGVRLLYLAVLVLLHRANLIRYERTATNGEYLQQLRRSAATPPALQAPFHHLIRLFEEKWYGQRACASEDYAACRGLAEEIQELVRS
ncbi:MAG TPA: DUF4129 domain-containing protein [Gemmataceae bacterium]|nr:DUF4129 domain-containing protein [Gemmataceae bacterium]